MRTKHNNRDWKTVRQPANDQSREQAINLRQFYEGWEVELILEWDGTEEDLATLAEMLGRTTEAIRQQHYVARRGVWREREKVAQHRPRPNVTVTRTVTTTTYHYDNWPDDECSEWYR